MDHVAFMKKKWNFIEKILAQEKTIETRFYKFKIAPWNRVNIGDTIYFKNSGGLIEAKATVSKVEQIKNLNPEKLNELLKVHYTKIGIPEDKYNEFLDLKSDRKFGILMYLENPARITPFNINKKGFGNAVAWISINDINKIKYEPTI